MPEIEIKDLPGIKSFLRNTAELSFTGFVWGIWIYMFLPILNIIMWFLGFSFFYIEVIEKSGSGICGNAFVGIL
jgi:poly-beta-1,6-N-acetyl-D-glucosamine biosynthesis protein PgaD